MIMWPLYSPFYAFLDATHVRRCCHGFDVARSKSHNCDIWENKIASTSWV